MKASTAYLKIKDAQPDANVFALVGGRYLHVEDILCTGVDPVVTGLTTVTLNGTVYVREEELLSARREAERLREELTNFGL